MGLIHSIKIESSEHSQGIADQQPFDAQNRNLMPKEGQAGRESNLWLNAKFKEQDPISESSVTSTDSEGEWRR